MATEVECPATETILGNEDLHCFVCDVAVTGKFYPLATCRARTTKTRLIEKLGHLVGERYMVVISEDDIICRGCANLMNTLDRLELEMRSVKNVVLRFLEKKYSLEEGELLNHKDTECGQPPQITPGQGRARTYKAKAENFMVACFSHLRLVPSRGVGKKRVATLPSLSYSPFYSLHDSQHMLLI
uniref:Uncharacterized protein n=1 Tax=Timema douglasi TaxID=61478 RepID=A0A7R8VRW8_TIMDO|nr:unnamed protein product [Timema douglasi]